MTEPELATEDDLARLLDVLHRFDHVLTRLLGDVKASVPATASWPIPRSWHEAEYSPRTSQLVDLTRPHFLRQCGARRVFVVGVRHLEEAQCCRRAFHTGRHAQGNGLTTTAVWED